MKRFVLVISLSLISLIGSSSKSTSANYSSNVAVTKNTLSTGTWSTVQDTVNDVKVALEDNNAPDLYNLMSADFTALFPLDDFTSAFNTDPSIVTVTYLETTQTLGESWHEQRVHVTYSDDTEASYNLIFKLEVGEWKLYATEDV